MPNDQTAVATRQTSEVGQFQAQLADRANEMAAVLPAHITPEKFQRTIVTAVANDPDLLKADRASLILACYKAAQDGLLPDKREAALVVFKQSYKDGNEWKQRKLVQYMPMVYGLRKKILQSNEVSGLEVGVVYAKEFEENRFYYNVGVEPPLGHKPSFDLTEEDTTDDKIVAAYSIATMKDGTKSFEVMRRFELNKVQNCSQTGALNKVVKFGKDKGKPIPPSGPWVEWYPEQAKKSVMRRHSKVLPQSGDVMIDVEGRELERNMSTLKVLGSASPDAPAALEDHYTDEDGDTIDQSTGEVLDEGNGDADDEVTSSSTQQPKQKQGSGSTATTAKETGSASQSDDDDASDIEGMTEQDIDEHPGRSLAEQLVNSFSEAKSSADLQKLRDNAVFDLEAMLSVHRNAVEASFKRNWTRLASTRDKAAAPAKEVAE